MINASSDVQGLTIFSWVMFGFIGSIICPILSLFGQKINEFRVSRNIDFLDIYAPNGIVGI